MCQFAGEDESAYDGLVVIEMSKTDNASSVAYMS